MACYTRPDSIFWWYWADGTDPPIRKSTGVLIGETPEQRKASRDLAQQVYFQAMADLARARHGLTPPPLRPVRTFREHAAWYAETVTPTKRVAVPEASLIRQLVAHFGDTPLEALDGPAILEWRRARARQVAPGSVNRELDVLKVLLGSAVPTYLAASPAVGIPGLHRPDFEPRLLADDEETRVLFAVDAIDRALILTALDTLMRLTSAVTLRRSEIRGDQVVVLNPKGGRRYHVPLSSRLQLALAALPVDGPYVFARYHPSPTLTPQARRRRVIAMFVQACTRANVPYGRKVGGVTFHSLRHTGASRMLAAGVDVQTVRQLGAWQDLGVLARYLHPTDAQRRRAVDLIGEPDRFRLTSDARST